MNVINSVKREIPIEIHRAAWFYSLVLGLQAYQAYTPAIDTAGPLTVRIPERDRRYVRPVLPFLTPPHCLKKNGTLAAQHWSRRDLSHALCIGQPPGPLSAPTMTQ